ncbi:MAG: hydrogenase-4 component [Pseudomonadota bacterium]|jgi:hydrogenase-4 component F
MIPLALVMLPALAGVVFVSRRMRSHARTVLLATALVAAALGLVLVLRPSQELTLGGYLRLDPTSRLFLALINPIFLGISVYVAGRLTATPALYTGLWRFVWLTLTFLGAANAVVLGNHLLLQWVMLEISTLVAAPLIVRPGVGRSRLASWRYLLFSSVGLSLVLFGFLCLERAMLLGGQEATFFIDRLQGLSAPAASPWGKTGLGLVLLGLGTKLGLAPMYTWLPEAYDEAPPAVSALLGAVQFNAALVLLLRVLQVYRPGNPVLVTTELLILGLASMIVSAISIIATRNMKRLIAYAAINHAGVIAIGLAVGKGTTYGVLMYVISNALIKAILFLTAGKIKAVYGTEDTREISGLIKDLPYSGVFLLVGTLALLGFPPFGSFFGELLILSALVTSGHLYVFSTFCLVITITFIATGRTIFPMIWGAPQQVRTWPRQTLLAGSPKIAFFVVLIALGLYLPPTITGLLEQVAASLEGP